MTKTIFFNVLLLYFSLKTEILRQVFNKGFSIASHGMHLLERDKPSPPYLFFPSLFHYLIRSIHMKSRMNTGRSAVFRGKRRWRILEGGTSQFDVNSITEQKIDMNVLTHCKSTALTSYLDSWSRAEMKLTCLKILT